MTTSQLTGPDVGQAPRAASHGFRADIQGLRAIAVALVVLYHLWPERITGGFAGVDVFFVISGFLITSHLMKSPPRRLGDFGRFWARRIRRLLPAAFLVLLCTTAAVRFLAPDTQWKDAGWQVVASAFYVQNWVLASSSVDYLAADDAPSPVQHFWSLSVEEQFYLVWPLLIALSVWWAARRAVDAHRMARLMMVIVVVASLAFSVYWTAANPGPAYFVTPTRMWELAMGGLVAVLPAASGVLHRGPRGLLAWMGIAGIFWTAFAYTSSTPFPSYTALLPVVATAVVLWARAEGTSSPSPILALRPVQYLGDISYSVYLWHWPIIALLPAVSDSLGPLDHVAVLVLSIVLAGLTKRFVEDKFRSTKVISSSRGAYRVAAAGMAVLLCLGAGLMLESNARTATAAAHAAEAESDAGPCFGARAMVRGDDECQPDDSAPMVPEPALAKDDKSAAYADGCWSNQPFTSRPVCTYGDGPVKVALVGNSHAGHWLPALRKIADERGWTIQTFLVSRCNPSDALQEFDTPEKSQNCYDYGQWVLEQTAHGQFDRIITSERQSVPVQGASWAATRQLAEKGYASYLQKWTADKTPVTVIRDVPYPGNTIKNIPDCLSENSGQRGKCAGTPKSWEWMDPLADAGQKAKSKDIDVVNMERYFCTDDTCPAVIGSVVVYFDSSHITATYSRTLSEALDRELKEATSK